MVPAKPDDVGTLPSEQPSHVRPRFGRPASPLAVRILQPSSITPTQCNRPFTEIRIGDGHQIWTRHWPLPQHSPGRHTDISLGQTGGAQRMVRFPAQSRAESLQTELARLDNSAVHLGPTERVPRAWTPSQTTVRPYTGSVRPATPHRIPRTTDIPG